MHGWHIIQWIDIDAWLAAVTVFWFCTLFVPSNDYCLFVWADGVPFHVPLEVNIVLVGFNGDGGYRYSLDARKLGEFMKSSFPTHRPACLETALPLDIEHNLYYNAIPLDFS
eukprot:Gb_29084 [translate_table: standard]